MSDRYNISIEGYEKGKPITKRLFFRDGYDARWAMDSVFENYDGLYTVKDIAEALMNDETTLMTEKWCQFQICDGLSEIRVDKEKRTIERIDWNPDYDNKKVFKND